MEPQNSPTANQDAPIFVPEPIPVDERSPSLKGYLRSWARDVASVRKHHPEALVGFEPTGFSFLCSYWLVPVERHPASYIDRHSLIESSGFDGERIKQELTIVLEEDRHLKECCDTELNVAYFVNDAIFYIGALIEDDKLTDEEYDTLYLQFSEIAYSQRFRKLSLSHLYNFDSTERLLPFDGVTIMRLETHDIPEVIGDSSVYNFLHNHQTGDYFAITESLGACPNIVEWLFGERDVAVNFLGILQYYKDGIVDIDYTSFYFLPEWVNKIRKRNLTFIGEPRRLPYDKGGRFYSLSKAEAQQVNRWWQIYQAPSVADRLGNFENNLRQVLLRAGNYYESSMQQKDAAARLVHLAIALEALFSPSDKVELSYKINLYATLLVSKDANERVENFKFLKSMYERRSALFHGTYDVNKDLLTSEEAERLAAVIRNSILRFLVLYLNGEQSRDNIHAKLRDGVLNQNIVDTLRADSDPESFIEQQTTRT